MSSTVELSSRPQPTPSLGEIKLLHLGCGPSRFEEFVNVDLFFHLNPWNRSSRANENRRSWFSLPFQNESFDGIFTERVFEHLSFSDAVVLLKECLRVLKKGHTMRLSIPCLDRENGESALWSLTSHWGHKSLWSSSWLLEVMRKVGFRKMEKVEFRKGRDARLLKDWKDRAWESCYLEGVK